MKGWIVALGIGALTTAFATPSVNLVDPSGQVSGGSIVVSGGGVCTTLAGQGLRLQLPQRFASVAINTGSADYSQWTHLVLTLTNNQSTAATADVAIDSGVSGWAFADVVLAPNSTRTVAVPLLNAQTAFPFQSWPSLDGFYNQATTFGTTTVSNVRMVRVWNIQQQGSLDLTLDQMTLVQQSPKTSDVVDQYGQQTVAFPGKILSDSDLTQQAANDALLSGQLPYSSDAYYGVAGSSFSQGTGRWRVEKQNGKWYIIDPVGNRFFSTGVCCVGYGTDCFTQDRLALFAPGALPDPNGSLGDHYDSPINPATGQPELAFNFYAANLERKFGPNWSALASSNNLRRLRTWGFNTIAACSDSSYYFSAQFPSMMNVTIGGNFRTVPTLHGDFAMPDVYDPAWVTAVGSNLAPLVPQLNANPYSVGLFIDNELPWAWHESQPNWRYDFAFDVLSAPSDQPAKRRFYNTVQLKYRTIQKLNTAWGTSYASWTAFLANRSYRPSYIRPALATDMQSFLTGFATQYFSTIKSKLQSLQYHGLYLGCRFLYYSPEALSSASRYCDVISFNSYDITPSQWRLDLKALDKPLLISEFGFSASDLGRAGGPGPVTEADRIAAYQGYVADAASWPNMVGVQWYKWDDDPATGRLWDNANHDLGLVAITDTPYALVNAATQVNAQLNSRLVNP